MATIRICDKCGSEVKINIDTHTGDHVVPCHSDAGFSFAIGVFKSVKYVVELADLCRKCLIEEVSFALLNL